jgi:hypothetical protein
MLVSPSNNLIDFTGTAAQIEYSFQTRIHKVQTANSELKYAAVKSAPFLRHSLRRLWGSSP